MSFESQIKQKGKELGFDLVGITTADPVDPAYAAYHQQWLASGYAARMDYLHRNNDKRFAPAKLLDGAQSVICVALNYRARNEELPAGSSPAISRYALYDDYHGFIKSRLFELAEFIQSLCTNRAIRFKACTDSIPLAERALAKRAGLGFIGRNHLLIHPKLGGQLFLGELLTTLALEPDAPLDGDFCGTCSTCLAACPSGALGHDGTFDARKCISYLTIEERDVINDECAGCLEGRLFGCDECLMACPYETDAPPRRNTDLTFHAEWALLSAEAILTWTQADFDAALKGSSLERLGLLCLQRNARLCLGKEHRNTRLA